MRALRTAAGSIGALALLGAAAAASAAERSAAVSELMGLSPAAVRARLVEGAEAWPLPAAFEISTPRGRLTFVTLHDLLADPVMRAQEVVARTHADWVPWAAHVECRETQSRGGAAPELAGLTVLAFRDDQLEGALRFVEGPPPQPPPEIRSDPKAMEAWVRLPVANPFIAHNGELPMEDGAGFLDRWPQAPLAGGDVLLASCVAATPPQPQTPARKGARALSASDWQGLALMPFAVTLPGKNDQRVKARQAGAALLATLHVGEPLGVTPAAFASAHRGVRAFSATGGDYAVLSVDLGGYPGRNLSNFNDAALVGVRAGKVEWISPPGGAGPRPDLLCIDAQGVGSTPRKGCSGWGHFNP